MSNKDLFKEAIADAKAVREAALANAKVALEEALAPKLQSMLAAKLQEMDTEELDEVEDKDEVEEGFHPETTGDLGQDRERAKGFALEEGDEESLEEDFDLSEILAELSENADEDADDTMKEAEEEAEEEVEVEDEESEDEMESEGDKITDLTVDELKDIIKDIISSELEAITVERASVIASTSPELVALYEKIRASNNGTGAAALVGNQCKGCHLTVNNVELQRIAGLAEDEVVRCEECRCILVRDL